MDRHALIDRVIGEVGPYTMVNPDGVEGTIVQTLAVIDAGLPGCLVECGTWMGGASFAMLLAQRYAYGRVVRPVWMFDSFEGLPPVGPRDGPAAAAWQGAVDRPEYHDNCAAPLDAVRAAAAGFGFGADEAIIVPGWFDRTLPGERERLSSEGIALLRIDCDWYEPVSFVLEELAPLVGEEGRIILDDYYFWDGCARAVHDYLSRHDLSWRIRSMGRSDYIAAWMIKRAHRATHQTS